MRVILLRHASAGSRKKWKGDDRLRPLDKRGRAQATALTVALASRGVTRVLSSPYLRCTQTVAPLRLDIELDDRLAEGTPVEVVQALLHRLDGAVACTHGDVVEAVVGRPLEKGAAVVLVDGRDVEEIAVP